VCLGKQRVVMVMYTKQLVNKGTKESLRVFVCSIDTAEEVQNGWCRQFEAAGKLRQRFATRPVLSLSRSISWRFKMIDDVGGKDALPRARFPIDPKNILLVTPSLPRVEIF
jgi:hypothetical protein